MSTPEALPDSVPGPSTALDTIAGFPGSLSEEEVEGYFLCHVPVKGNDKKTGACTHAPVAGGGIEEDY
jgi:hypothetical protein